MPRHQLKPPQPTRPCSQPTSVGPPSLSPRAAAVLLAMVMEAKRRRCDERTHRPDEAA